MSGSCRNPNTEPSAMRNKWAYFVDRLLLPYYKKEEYFKNLSDRKLIKAAIRVLHPHIRLYTAQEAIFEEMIKRLEKSAGVTEFMHKIKPEIHRRIEHGNSGGQNET